MSSYEEMVIDREVEAAWLQFRVRLADHLAAMDQGDTVILVTEDGADEIGVVISIDAIADGGHFVTWEWPDGQSRAGVQHDLHPWATRHDVDASVRRIHDVLRAEGVLHPAFLTVDECDLVLVDPPQSLVAPASEPRMPESVTPSSGDDLRQWVDRTIDARPAYDVRRRKDGTVLLNRDEGQVAIRISRSRLILEVWSIVARDVDVRRARKHVARMNARFHFFTFSLVGDRIVVSTTVNAHPFCPEHLYRAIGTTFDYLDGEARTLQERLARREAPAPSPVEATDAFDPDLLLVFGVAGDRAATIELATTLAGGARSRLDQWRLAARQASDEALARISAGPDDAVVTALVEHVIAWGSVGDALTAAILDARPAPVVDAPTDDPASDPSA